MAPFRRSSSPNENETENNLPQNNHRVIFRRAHWTNEPNHINWETYHRLLNQFSQLEMEILIWNIEIAIKPHTTEHLNHLQRLKRLYRLTYIRLNAVKNNNNNSGCPYCNQRESENDSSNETDSTNENEQWD